MHQNTFLTTPDVKKIIFKGLDSGGLEVCANAKTRFEPLQTLKNNF
jgi:hypothetical protein